jgi:hypothetical protein
MTKSGPVASRVYFMRAVAAAFIGLAATLSACAGSPASSRTPQAAQSGISTRVAARSDEIAIAGTGFGAARGQVWFAAPHGARVPGAVSNWSASLIRVAVPASAVTGPVQVVAADGQTSNVGALVVEGAPNGVVRVSYTLPASPAAGQPLDLNLLAQDSSRRGVSGVEVSITDGLGALSCTTDSRGSCRVALTLYSSASYIEISGTAWTAVAIEVGQPRPLKLTLGRSAASLLIGKPATITVGVVAGQGGAVPDLLVTFESRGSVAPDLSASQAITDVNGAATITATSASPGVAFLTASANNGAATAVVQIGWSTALVESVSPSAGPAAGNSVVNISGAGFTATAKVYFGPYPALRVTFVSYTTLKAVSPAGRGKVDVRVEVDGYASDLTPADAYTYGT